MLTKHVWCRAIDPSEFVGQLGFRIVTAIWGFLFPLERANIVLQKTIVQSIFLSAGVVAEIHNTLSRGHKQLHLSNVVIPE